VIERDLPGAGKLSAAELQAISRKSNSVLAGWEQASSGWRVTSPPTRSIAVYRAQSEEAIRKHAEAGGFPANRISRVTSVIDPTTAH